MINYTSAMLFFHIVFNFLCSYSTFSVFLSFFMQNKWPPHYSSSISRQKEQPMKNRLFIIARHREEKPSSKFSMECQDKMLFRTWTISQTKFWHWLQLWRKHIFLIKKFRSNQVFFKVLVNENNFMRFLFEKNVFKSTNWEDAKRLWWWWFLIRITLVQWINRIGPNPTLEHFTN